MNSESQRGALNLKPGKQEQKKNEEQNNTGAKKPEVE